MKKITSLLLVLITFCSYAQAHSKRNSILDDLGSMRLRVDRKGLSADVHYPNYRMGGGTPPTRLIVDCFVLDILDSDNQIDANFKMSIAQELKVLEGFTLVQSEKTELIPEFKGDNVVFKIKPGNLYVTSFTVTTRSEKSLLEALNDKMPSTRQGNSLSPVNLLYIRGCRL